MSSSENIRIAVLDLYEGTPNEGMRNIRELIEGLAIQLHVPLRYDIFDVRQKAEVPGPDYDAYISSGGPGSPLSTEGTEWEHKYFGLMDALQEHNRHNPGDKKHVLLICHSFQVFTRYYRYGVVSKRKSSSFGVLPVYKTSEGRHDPMLKSLGDPFWTVDSRDYQITQPDDSKIRKGGGAILCLEKLRPHVDLERAVMAIRFDEAFIGTQFHPEADPVGMRMYLLRTDKKELVVEKHGEQKYREMLDHLNDPDKIRLTNQTVIPRFLMNALQQRLISVSP